MSETRTYIVPQKAANDGWTQIPQWLFTEARCVPMPAEEWTLPDGSVAHAGDTIRLRDGTLELIRATETAETQAKPTV